MVILYFHLASPDAISITFHIIVVVYSLFVNNLSITPVYYILRPADGHGFSQRPWNAPTKYSMN